MPTLMVHLICTGLSLLLSVFLVVCYVRVSTARGTKRDTLNCWLLLFTQPLCFAASPFSSHFLFPFSVFSFAVSGTGAVAASLRQEVDRLRSYLDEFKATMTSVHTPATSGQSIVCRLSDV